MLDVTIYDSDDEDEIPSVKDQKTDPGVAVLNTAERQAAATLIQRAFRRRFKPGVRDRAHSFFKTCLASTSSGLSGSGYYRKLFLGPLPHVLACLHGAETKVRWECNRSNLL